MRWSIWPTPSRSCGRWRSAIGETCAGQSGVWEVHLVRRDSQRTSRAIAVVGRCAHDAWGRLFALFARRRKKLLDKQPALLYNRQDTDQPDFRRRATDFVKKSIKSVATAGANHLLWRTRMFALMPVRADVPRGPRPPRPAHLGARSTAGGRPVGARTGFARSAIRFHSLASRSRAADRMTCAPSLGACEHWNVVRARWTSERLQPVITGHPT